MLGIIPVYKPKGPTSNDVVQMVKKKTGQKVGHAGTLDPLASGVLVIGIGREATKKLGEIVLKEKEYLAKIFLGQNSTTDDNEGKKEIVSVKKIPTALEVKKILDGFVGKIMQQPPIYSAIKVKGKEAYKLARQGKPVALKQRLIEIKSIDLISYKYPNLEIKVVTGPGVYIRSLARDIGAKLQCGGYLAELERTRVGQYDKNQSKKIDEIN